MEHGFFKAPILNSPYEYPSRHWELDNSGQPTHKVIESRRPVTFITPVPKPKKQKHKPKQTKIVLDEG
jgi:type III restriction enzyme